MRDRLPTAQALAAAIAEPCRQRERWPAIGAANLQIVRQRGDRHSNLLVMEEIYERLIDGRVAGSGQTREDAER